MIDFVIGLIAMLVLLFLVTLAYHLLTPVPFVPTPKHIARAMESLIPWKGAEHVIDLGAGDGRLLAHMKKQHPGITAEGCEIIPTVWLCARLRSVFTRNGIRIKLKSLRSMDVSAADVIFLYLFPALMQELSHRFDRELKPGTYVASQTFGFPDKKPLKEVRVPRFGGEVSVFLYRW